MSIDHKVTARVCLATKEMDVILFLFEKKYYLIRLVFSELM